MDLDIQERRVGGMSVLSPNFALLSVTNSRNKTIERTLPVLAKESRC